jgi:hypothetical protein
MNLRKNDWEILGNKGVDINHLSKLILDNYQFECALNPKDIPNIEQLIFEDIKAEELLKISSFLEYGDFNYYVERVNNSNAQQFWKSINTYYDTFYRDCSRLVKSLSIEP